MFYRNILIAAVFIWGLSPSATAQSSKPVAEESCQADPPNQRSPEIVITDGGLVRGSHAGDTHSFKGIPYAAPPVGALRWKGPQPVPCWSGVRDALEFGSPCAQLGTPPGSTMTWFGSEDCLTLNIWTPAMSFERDRLPVMVFVHGGGNTRGSGSASVPTSVPFIGPNVQDGQRLAELGRAVVVTLNYRLGFLGWLAHPALSKASDTGTSGNYGLQDQLAALKWVRRNIRHFGGNPRRVLVFGQSSGGRDVCALLASPWARGLISRAGIISSSCENLPTSQQAEDVGVQYASSLGCATAADVLGCMRGVPTEVAVRASVTQPPRFQGFQLGPMVDGFIVGAQPLTVFRSPLYMPVPVHISSTANEVAFSLFRLYWPGPIATANDYASAVITLAPPQLVADILSLYPVSNYPTPRAALTALLSDVQLLCPSRRAARALAAAGQPVWRSIWMHTESNGPLQPIGPGHVTDLPYWFDNLATMPSFTPSASESALAQSMALYLANFARTGDPNHAGALAWPAFTVPDAAELRLDDRPTVGSAFRDSFCDSWDARMPPPGYQGTDHD
jgi:para-nitrobenzyl esterase